MPVDDCSCYDLVRPDRESKLSKLKINALPVSLLHGVGAHGYSVTALGFWETASVIQFTP